MRVPPLMLLCCFSLGCEAESSVVTPGVDSRRAAATDLEIPHPAESEGHPVWQFNGRLSDGRSVRQDADGVFVDHEQVGTDPAAPVSMSRDAGRFVFVDRMDGDPRTRLVGCGAGAACRVLVEVGHPDRATIAPDGSSVAYVASLDGMPAVWVVPFDGGAPRPLTNEGLVRVPGEAPQGFVPPPVEASIAFDADELVWFSSAGEHRVAWR